MEGYENEGRRHFGEAQARMTILLDEHKYFDK